MVRVPVFNTVDLKRLVRIDHISYLYRSALSEIGVGTLLVIVAFCSLWGSNTQGIAAFWTGALMCIYALRIALNGLYQRSFTRNKNEALWLTAILSSIAITGIAWGVFNVMISTYDTGYRPTLILLCTGCIAMAMLAIYSGASDAVYAYAMPALAPTIAYHIFQVKADNLAVAVVLVIYTATLLIASRRLTETLFAYWRAREEGRLLLDDVDNRKEQVSTLSIALKTHAEKQERTASELQRTTAVLESSELRARALAGTLVRISTKCSVTGLLNIRHFTEILATEWPRLMRDKKPLSLIMFDLDDGERNRDFYRSTQGAKCLRRIANIIRNFSRRAGDVAARHDGTRFSILLPGADTANASRIAESLRREVETQRVMHAALDPGAIVTIHTGVATVIPSRSRNPNDLIEYVDTALYEARFQGGNRVVCYRALQNLMLERWDNRTDGQPSEEGVVKKLALRGYQGQTNRYEPDSKISDHCPDIDSVHAVVRGRLRITLDGQSMVLCPGDCLFFPPGSTCSAAVASNEAVYLLEAVKAQ